MTIRIWHSGRMWLVQKCSWYIRANNEKFLVYRICVVLEQKASEDIGSKKTNWEKYLTVDCPLEIHTVIHWK